MPRPLSDSRIRGTSRYGGQAPWTASHDPPYLMPCPMCLETVIAAHKLYFDNPRQEHRHKPHLGKQHYGTPDGL